MDRERIADIVEKVKKEGSIKVEAHSGEECWQLVDALHEYVGEEEGDPNRILCHGYNGVYLLVSWCDDDLS